MNQASLSRSRVYSIDVLRGLIMIIMALDHARDFFHVGAFQQDPLDLSTTTPLLFFTRWITHFCAPVFVLLSGASAYLVGLRKGRRELSVFLIKRGLWLVLIEVIVVTLGWSFDIFYHFFILQVIWVIGWSMVLLGLLVRFLSWKVVLALGVLIIGGHNLLDAAEAARQQQVGFWWDLLHHGSFVIYPVVEGHSLLILYALVPWAGVMFAGYGLGRIFDPAVTVAQRRKWLEVLGAALILVFVVVRWTNAYGNPMPWSLQRNGFYTVLSFLNVHKYPPSLLYVCITIGPALLLLAAIDNMRNRFSEVCRVFGAVPFFYYVAHLYLIHLIGVILFFASGYGVKDIVTPGLPFNFRPLILGVPLGTVYLLWLVVLIILYPLCRWYGQYKRTHQQWWLSYL